MGLLLLMGKKAMDFKWELLAKQLECSFSKKLPKFAMYSKIFYFILFFKKVEPCHIPMAFFLFIRISRSIVVLLKKNLRAFLCFYNTKSGTLQFFFFFFFLIWKMQSYYF